MSIVWMLFAAAPAANNWVGEGCGGLGALSVRSRRCREEPQRVWSTVLSTTNLIAIVLIAIRMITVSKVRVLLRSIFRRPSQKTFLVEVDDRWVETSDDPAVHGRGSRNGGAGSRG